VVFAPDRRPPDRLSTSIGIRVARCRRSIYCRPHAVRSEAPGSKLESRLIRPRLGMQQELSPSQFTTRTTGQPFDWGGSLGHGSDFGPVPCFIRHGAPINCRNRDLILQAVSGHIGASCSRFRPTSSLRRRQLTDRFRRTPAVRQARGSGGHRPEPGTHDGLLSAGDGPCLPPPIGPACSGAVPGLNTAEPRRKHGVWSISSVAAGCFALPT
jgi:hypothetical protein